MNEAQEPTTLELDAEQVAYLREMLAHAASEGERVEDRISADGPEVWGGDYPDGVVNAAYERSAVASSILGRLD